MIMYNNRIKMKDLFVNSEMAGILPQYNPNVQEDAGNRILKYLQTALNGSVTAKGELTVKGQKDVVLRQIKTLVPLLEALFNNFGSVVKNIRSNTRLYLPYVSKKQIADVKSFQNRVRVFREILDNFQYNSDFKSLNSVADEEPSVFARAKREWESKVGYRRLKQI